VQVQKRSGYSIGKRGGQLGDVPHLGFRPSLKVGEGGKRGQENEGRRLAGEGGLSLERKYTGKEQIEKKVERKGTTAEKSGSISTVHLQRKKDNKPFHILWYKPTGKEGRGHFRKGKESGEGVKGARS